MNSTEIIYRPSTSFAFAASDIEKRSNNTITLAALSLWDFCNENMPEFFYVFFNRLCHIYFKLQHNFQNYKLNTLEFYSHTPTAYNLARIIKKNIRCYKIIITTNQLYWHNGNQHTLGSKIPNKNYLLKIEIAAPYKFNIDNLSLKIKNFLGPLYGFYFFISIHQQTPFYFYPELQ